MSCPHYSHSLHPVDPEFLSGLKMVFCVVVCQNKPCVLYFSLKHCLNGTKMVHRLCAVPLVSPAPVTLPSVRPQGFGKCMYLTQRDPANLLHLIDALISLMNGLLKLWPALLETGLVILFQWCLG